MENQSSSSINRLRRSQDHSPAAHRLFRSLFLRCWTNHQRWLAASLPTDRCFVFDFNELLCICKLLFPPLLPLRLLFLPGKPPPKKKKKNLHHLWESVGPGRPFSKPRQKYWQNVCELSYYLARGCSWQNSTWCVFCCWRKPGLLSSESGTFTFLAPTTSTPLFFFVKFDDMFPRQHKLCMMPVQRCSRSGNGVAGSRDMEQDEVKQSKHYPTASKMVDFLQRCCFQRLLIVWLSYFHDEMLLFPFIWLKWTENGWKMVKISLRTQIQNSEYTAAYIYLELW